VDFRLNVSSVALVTRVWLSLVCCTAVARQWWW
jgi:hypothetical protein